MLSPSPSNPTLPGRALLLHCPKCGGGSLFQTSLSMRDRCPSFSNTLFLAFDLVFRTVDETETAR